MAVTVAVMGSSAREVEQVAAQVLAVLNARPVGRLLELSHRDPISFMRRYEVLPGPAGSDSALG